MTAECRAAKCGREEPISSSHRMTFKFVFKPRFLSGTMAREMPMTRTTIARLSLLGLFLMAGLTFVFIRSSHQPPLVYKGVPLDRWIELTDGASRDISTGLAEIGPQAIPHLIRA